MSDHMEKLSTLPVAAGGKSGQKKWAVKYLNNQKKH